ncbi:MAG: hypothetical protein ACJ76J_03395 [Thermoanaerobaculia bacterium]
MNEIVLGVLGRAQRLHPVEISAFFVASNHYHILAWVPDAERMSKLRGKDFEPRRHATEETGELSQLPCWRHLSPEMYRELIAGLVQEIEADAAAQRKRTGREPLGAAAILRQHPHTCPNKSKKSPAPRFHAATKAARGLKPQALCLCPSGAFWGRTLSRHPLKGPKGQRTAFRGPLRPLCPLGPCFSFPKKRTPLVRRGFGGGRFGEEIVCSLFSAVSIHIYGAPRKSVWVRGRLFCRLSPSCASPPGT